jgi:hypothetical protein
MVSTQGTILCTWRTVAGGETAINLPTALGNINADSLHHHPIHLWRPRRDRGIGVTVNSQLIDSSLCFLDRIK